MNAKVSYSGRFFFGGGGGCVDSIRFYIEDHIKTIYFFFYNLEAFYFFSLTGYTGWSLRYNDEQKW